VATVSRDRAQLLLVGGLAIAVGLVALAVVLNSGIYTHNLASRADPTASEAVGYGAVVRDSTEGLVEFAVAHHPNDFTAQEANVTAGVVDVSGGIARESAGHGLLTNATVAATFEGRTVNQTGDRVFTDQDGDTDWEVADDAHGVRTFRMDVQRSSLNESSLPVYSGAFNVTFDPASGGDLIVSLYRDGSGSTVVRVTDEGTGRTFEPCADDTGTRTVVDLTGATVAEDHCPALERLGDVPRPFDVEFSDTDNVTGTYDLVVNTTTVGDVGAPGASGPSGLETLYSVHLELRFRSQRVDYATTVTAAPGEPDA
jgi:hypothetical protein